MKKNLVFLYFCLMFIMGVVLRSIFCFDLFYAFIFCLTCLIVSVVVWQKKLQCILLLGATFLFLGILRFELSLPKINEKHIAAYNNSQIELIGQVSTEPDIREKSQKITINNLQLTTNNKKIKGKVLITTNKFQKFNYGEWVKIKCNLQAPGIIKSEDGDFDYGRYLSVSGIYSTCYQFDNLEIVSIESHRFTQIRKQIYIDILQAKQKFKQIIDKNLPLPYSGILNAMLLGYKREITAETQTNFSQTGLSHMIAISGLHITILAGLFFYLFINLGVSRSKSFWPAIFILFLYVLLIGFRASALRAFIMGAIVLYALKIGRLSKSINALLLSAVILLCFNPKLLLFDIGFQLSFLAVLGILYLFPVFYKWLNFITDKFKIRSMLCLTLSAQIFTLPLVIYYFNVASLIAPIANLLILPILPIIMIAGILLILTGLIWSKLSFVVGIIIWILLSYVLQVVEILSKIPFGHFGL